MYDPCELCIYSTENMDIIGHVYYTCDIQDFDDNNPDNYPKAECCKKGVKKNAKNTIN